MIKKISIKTKMGWISAFENKGKIFKVKFGKAKKQSQSKVLKDFKKNLLTFFKKKNLNIKSPYKIQGNQIQKKIWEELKNIRFWKKLVWFIHRYKKISIIFCIF